MPIEADGIANTAGENLPAGAVGVDAGDGCIDRLAAFTDVARRPHRHVQLSIGTERDELP
jgi:hypothetical protein